MEEIFENRANSSWQLAKIWSSGFRSFGSRLHRSLTMTVGSAAVFTTPPSQQRARRGPRFAPRSFGKLRPSADTLGLRLGLGLGLGDPWVTLGSRLGDARVTQASN